VDLFLQNIGTILLFAVVVSGFIPPKQWIHPSLCCGGKWLHLSEHWPILLFGIVISGFIPPDQTILLLTMMLTSFSPQKHQNHHAIAAM
jgi:hypothetical protein